MQEKRKRNILGMAIRVLGSEEYITQVSEETEGRVTEKLSQYFSRTDSYILGALSNLDNFLFNPTDTDTLRKFSGSILEHNPGKLAKPKVNRSEDDPRPEVGPSVFQSDHSNGSDPDKTPHSFSGSCW